VTPQFSHFGRCIIGDVKQVAIGDKAGLKELESRIDKLAA